MPFVLTVFYQSSYTKYMKVSNIVDSITKQQPMRRASVQRIHYTRQAVHQYNWSANLQYETASIPELVVLLFLVLPPHRHDTRRL